MHGHRTEPVESAAVLLPAPPMSELPPSPQEFAEQLIKQVLRDVDGVLLDPQQRPALELLGEEALRGRARGATLLLLAQAAVQSLRALIHGDEPQAQLADQTEAEQIVQHLLQAPAIADGLEQQVERIEHFLSDSEPQTQGPAQNLARAVVRLYAGLQNNDEALGGRGLIELRALVVHLDAVAMALQEAGSADQPIRVVRPDRFHDAFMRLTEHIREKESTEIPVATLTQDGKITAVIKDDSHPVAAALHAAREHFEGSKDEKDAAVQRMLALLLVFERIRHKDLPSLEGALEDPALYLGVVTAGATAPLTQSGFVLNPLSQIAGYNKALFGQAESSGPTH